MKKVSVIIPYFNNEGTILRALESVYLQTYKNIEIILINDGSTDNSERIVKEWIVKKNIQHIINLSQSNKGPSVARNRGIKIASGDYVAFLDADDSWNEKKLEIQMNVFEKNKDIAILGSDYELNYNNKMLIKGKNNGDLLYVTFNQRLLKNYFNTPSVIIRKSILIDNNIFFNESQKYAEDTMLYLEVLRENIGAKICSPLITLYKPELSKEGLSSNIIKTEKYELINFYNLYRKNNMSTKKITFSKLMFLYIFSIIKFLRRILIMICR